MKFTSSPFKLITTVASYVLEPSFFFNPFTLALLLDKKDLASVLVTFFPLSVKNLLFLNIEKVHLGLLLNPSQ